MSAPKFTDTGLSIQTYEEIYLEQANALKEIYGDINLDSNSPDGQRVGILSKAIFDMQVFSLSFYNSLDKDLATGEQLKIIGKISGVRPRAALQSTWDLTLTSTQSFILPATFTIKDYVGNRWSTERSTSIPVGDLVVTFKSEEFGAITGTAGTEFIQDTVEPNITKIVALGAAIPGVAEVTDAEYRTILRESVQNPSYSTTGRMLSALYSVAGVTAVVVHENSSDTFDVTGTPGHSLWCIIENGLEEDIARTMLFNKTAGTTLRGSVTISTPEVLYIVGQGQVTLSHSMHFDRPAYIPLYIKANVSPRAGYGVVDRALIKKELAKVIFKISEDVEATLLYGAAYQAGTDFFVTALQVSRDNTVFTDGQLVAEINERFTLSEDNIVLTEV